VRVYLPATLPLLRGWAAAQTVGPAPVTGYAVTAALREWYTAGDAEELEYAAQRLAADAALRLLAADADAARRRVVLAVDTEAVRVRDDLATGAVEVTTEPAWHQVDAALVDEEESEGVVTAAVAAVDDADLGDEDAQFVVDETQGVELLWWAAQEIAEL